MVKYIYSGDFVGGHAPNFFFFLKSKSSRTLMHYAWSIIRGTLLDNDGGVMI